MEIKAFERCNSATYGQKKNSKLLIKMEPKNGLHGKKSSVRFYKNRLRRDSN